MGKGNDWLYWLLGGVIGYEVFFNPTSPIYYSTLVQTLSNMSAVASGIATNISTSASTPTTTNTNINSLAAGSTASPSLGPSNSSIEDIPITYYSQLLLKG